MRHILTILLISISINLNSQTFDRKIPADTKVITEHSTNILGKKVNYLAQIGTQPIWDSNGEVIATLHYTYYKRTDIDDNSNRPLVFSFNGGPGIYVPDEGFGVRLEDDVVIQSEGEPKNLMSDIVIEADEIEDIMNN